jgi:rhodanese-related sulfurtransferase
MPAPVDRERLRELASAGAQIVEVLPRDEYEDAHLSGAINLPLKELRDTIEQFPTFSEAYVGALRNMPKRS